MTTRLRFTLNRNESRVVQFLQLLRGLFPLKLQGVITLLVTSAALSIYGYGSLDLIVFALSICALAILVFCLFCTIISGIFTQRRIYETMNSQPNLQSKHAVIAVEAGYPNESGFALKPLRYFPLVKLSWKIVYPDLIQTRLNLDIDGLLQEEIIPSKRFFSDKIIRVFEVADVLGFCSYSWRQEQNVSAKALPKTDATRTIPLLRSLTAEDGIPNPAGEPEGDLMEIRPYVAGDSVRHIMWKVFARNRQLNVRLAEKSVFHSKRTVAYLLSSTNDEAAAAIARVAIESQAFGEDWAFAADGSETPCTTISSALDAVAKSRALGTPYAYGLDNFLQQAIGRSGAHCILFAAAESAPWASSLKNTIARFPGQFSLIMATDGFKSEDPESFWQRIAFREPDSGKLTQSTATMDDLRRVLTELGQLVESTIVIDRKSGQSFDKSLRRV